MDLTPRQRLLTTLRHEVADRLPWAPKFATWFDVHKRRNQLPPILFGCEHWHDAARTLGVDIFDKCGAVVRASTPSVQMIETLHPANGVDDAVRVVRYVTPVGELRRVYTRVDDYAQTVYTTEYPVKEPEDLRVWHYLLDDTIYEPCYDEYLKWDAAIGDDGITMSSLPDSPLHQVFVEMMGYERGTLAFIDDPVNMGALCDHIMAKNEEHYALAMASPAEVMLTGENTNSDFETPTLFRQYSFPTLKRASELCHAHDKLHWVHACGKLRVLLPQFREAGIDGIESLTPPPYADTPLWVAREELGHNITIDGGISPHLLVQELAPGELQRTVLELFRRMAPGDNFVLSVSDDTPTDALLGRILEVGQLVEDFGRLPMLS